MKQTAAILAVLILILCLSACSKPTYEEGYEDGYSDAEFEVEYLMEAECQGWYDMGYSDGYYEGSNDGWVDNLEEIGRFFEEDAVDFVREHCQWHPEEAVCIIEAYRNNEPFYENGSPPSRQDYLDAIDSLIYFYEYFYGSYYE